MANCCSALVIERLIIDIHDHVSPSFRWLMLDQESDLVYRFLYQLYVVNYVNDKIRFSPAKKGGGISLMNKSCLSKIL